MVSSFVVALMFTISNTTFLYVYCYHVIVQSINHNLVSLPCYTTIHFIHTRML